MAQAKACGYLNTCLKQVEMVIPEPRTVRRAGCRRFSDCYCQSLLLGNFRSLKEAIK
jgi:hypothetical protein